MSYNLVWDKPEERFFEQGVDHGVLFVYEDGEYQDGVVWNGLTAVNEEPTGAEATAVYADNIKYLNLRSVEEFGCTIEAYTYPEEFEECDGSRQIAPGVSIGQQPRKRFGFSYRTMVGSEMNPEGAYKIHMVYGCSAAPTSKSRATINDSPEAAQFSWGITTTPVEVEGFNPTAILSVDSRTTSAEGLADLLDILYGTGGDSGGTAARLPLPDEVAQLVGTGA